MKDLIKLISYGTLGTSLLGHIISRRLASLLASKVSSVLNYKSFLFR